MTLNEVPEQTIYFLVYTCVSPRVVFAFVLNSPVGQQLVDGDTAILPSQFNTIIVDSLAESMLTVSCRSEEIGGSSRETLSNSVAALLNVN